jgi:hypothetical protein
MRKSNTPLVGDMLMIRIQALEWVQGRVQDLILNKVQEIGRYIITNRYIDTLKERLKGVIIFRKLYYNSLVCGYCSHKKEQIAIKETNRPIHAFCV